MITEKDIGKRCKIDTIDYENEYGRIVWIDPDDSWIAVEFDNSFPWMHSCAGRCRENRGVWVNKENITIIDDYKIEDLYIKDFSAKDLYLLNFPQEEFLKFMKEWDDFQGCDFDESLKQYGDPIFKIYPSLKDNIRWLLEKGLVEMKPKETKLKSGDILKTLQSDGRYRELIVMPDMRLYIGKGWRINDDYLEEISGKDYYATTLENLNKKSGYVWKIK
jgi:hypothetical protein